MWSPWRFLREVGIALDELPQLRAARPPAGPDVAARSLDLLDVHVRVEGDREEVVRRGSRREPASAPVVGNAPLVQPPPLDDERLEALGHEHARLDRRARR